MKTFTRVIRYSLVALATFFLQSVHGQSVLDPSDPIVNYNSSAPPTQPAFGQIGKWVRTPRLNWNTTGYKAYIYKGNQFRLKFPKTYNPTANDGKKYPMLIFFHGVGEAGTIYDNEYSLYHGGQIFNDAVDNGTFDGYVFVMQTQGGWGVTQYQYIKEIIDYMITNNKLDPFHIVDNGLSGGAQGTWEMLLNFPTYIASSLPMSGVYSSYAGSSVVNLVKYTPIWNSHGGLDGAPSPYTAQQVKDAMNAAGANYIDTMYANLGHGVWDTFWGEPNFWPYINKSYMSNPWALFGRTDFCPGDPINVTIGLVAGLQAYQWRKDGVIISGATSNSIQATQTGTYDARVERGGIWSDWSHIPVVVKIKTPTVSPDIQLNGLVSKVIPAPDGNSGASLAVPTGYTSYLWQKVGNPTTLSTTNTLYATSPGDYQVKVTELYGCSSNFSNPFTVINANGLNPPDAAINLAVTPLSKTSLKLDWSDNPTPQYNETNFEIYQGTESGGPYKFIGMVGADVLTYTVAGLNANSKYYYKVRAVDATAASPLSNEAFGSTDADTQPPTPPGNLVIAGSTRSSISLSWDASTDDVGVTQYLVYVNGQKSFVTTQTQFTVNGLSYGQSYNFSVKAKDFAGNFSQFSNQVTGQPLLNGLNYKYYTFVGTWNNLPDFGTLTPDVTGIMPNISITPRTQDDNFAFLWEGYINIPVSGTYYFRTNSDDGSRLWLGSLNGTTSPYSFSGTPLVNNDGLHGTQNVTSSAISLTKGVYPIAVAYYEQGGGQSITVSWRTPQTGSSYVTIPNSAFADPAVVNGQAPNDPSALVATTVSYNQINLTWTDNSSNETGFEIWRSTNSSSGFSIVDVAPANATAYSDNNGLSANTTYYYQIRAIGQYGESNFVSNLSSDYTDALWKFNNNYLDSSGNSRNLTSSGNPAFNSTDKKEGTHSLSLNGTSQYVTPSSSSFLQSAYSQKTISFWMKSANNTGNRVIVDIGGSDDGLALRLDQNRLYAGIASNNTKVNFYVNYSYASTVWNYVTLVYSVNSLKLYLNGQEVGANNALPFSSVTTTTNGSRIGTVNSSNAFGTATGYYSGLIDNFAIFNRAMTPAEITNLMNNQVLPQSFATTASLPDVPMAPSNFIASGVSKSAINISWTDNANDEISYELYRSGNNNTNYILLSNLPANTTSYVDSGLFANSTFYYKVRAVGVGGNSVFATEDSARTLNSIPVIVDLSDRSVRYGVSSSIQITASDADGDPLSFTILNNPSFGTLVDNGNKTATLAFNPAISNQGVFNNIQVIVTDTHGASDTTSFNLTVNDNYAPVISAISNYSVNENSIINIPLTATDQNSTDVLTWSVANLPDAYTLKPGSNGSDTLSIKPTYAAAGTYTVQVNVNDGHGGIGTAQFTLTVIDQTPSTTKVYLRFQHQVAAGSPWNNITGLNTSNLKDTTNTGTGIGFQLLTPWWSTWNEGPQTGNNSGLYPDIVSKEYYFFGQYPGIFTGPDSVQAKFTGLDTSRKYNLSFYAGSAWSVQANNGTTTFSLGGQTIPLNVQNNLSNIAVFSGVKPQADGTITFSVGKTASTLVGYLNAIALSSIFDDGTAPAAPKSFMVQNSPGQGIQLSWQDVAYNETGYEIYRSLSSGGSYSMIGQPAANSTAYLDGNVNGNTQYFYKVRAVNGYGQSAFSSEQSATTTNRTPAINAISNVVIKNNQVSSINVTASDDPTDTLTLTATGLPNFVTFTDNGNGTGVINISPSAGSIGTYSGVTITVSDNHGANSSTNFDISVVDKDVTSVYVNFTDGVITAPKPWNNFVAQPFAGSSLSNLKDDGDTQTPISVTLVNGFQWYIAAGMRPGNGKEIYPVSVMRTALYEGSTNTRTIQVSGLSATKKYNFVFFNSHEDGFKGLTNFTINGTTVSLNATYNINKTVQINGIAPDANGRVSISVAKAAGQDYAFVSSMVIQSYDNTVTLLSPTDLRIVGLTRTSATLQWADRSSDETGFEIWRATSSNGSYSLLTTVAANSTSFTNSGLNANTSYYYIVRAIKTGAQSNYSNVASATTYSAAVYVNFANTNQAGSPWNNTNTNPQLGYVWNNFTDETGVPSNIGMTVTKNFDGLYTAGMNTGNNSGIVPDKVMIDSYGLFPGNDASIKLIGLDISKVYDLTFFASSQTWGDINTAYIVNGDTVLLDASVNTTGTVTMYGVSPDENGEILIKIAPGTPTSQFGLVGGMVVQAFNAPANSLVPQAPAAMILNSGNNVNNLSTQRSQPVIVSDEEVIAGKLNVYPNPFNQGFTLQLPVNDNSVQKAQIMIYNSNGQLVYSNQVSSLIKGNNYIKIDANQRMQSAGVYIVKVTYLGSSSSSVIRVIKER